MATARLHSWGNGPRTPRRVSLVLVVLLLCATITGALVTLRFLPGRTTGAQASTLVQLPGHIPGLVKRSVQLGAADPNSPIQLMIGLRPRNAQALKSYVDSLSRSHSTTAHRYLKPAQIAAAFAPAPTAQNAFIAYMQQAGFRLTQTYTDHLMLGFTGTIGEAEQAFQIQINNYRSPTGRQFYAPDTEPSVPAALAPVIQSISGLDTARVFTHPPVIAKQRSTPQSASPRVTCPTAQSGPFNYYLPGQIASAYNLSGLYSSSYRGEGQTIGLLELDDYVSYDISTYTSCYGGSSVPISRILVNGGTGHAPGSGAIEVELDMELVLSAAPRLASLKVYEAANTVVGYIADWSQMIYNDAVPIISTSWGSCESSGFAQAVYSQENSMFQIAALQGQTILAAAGDSGSNDCGNTMPTTPAVDDPASQPYVTGVGGTTLSLNSNGSYNTESVWNNSYGSGGGGISSLWSMPSWQQGPGVINSFSSNVPCGASAGSYCREVPDVALNADPTTGYAVYCTAVAQGSSGPCFPGNPWLVVGGTSAGAPMWAAMVALANEKSLHDGNFNLGFLDPMLYQIDANASSTSYSNDFHDTTTGSNYTTGDGNNEYPAGANYDMASGLGSYNAAALAADLEKLAKNQTSSRTSPANTTWYFAEGSVGGSFSEYITLLNPDPVNAATVNVTYLFQNKPAVTVQHQFPASSRFTINVNADLGVPTNAAQQAISAIVQSVANNGIPAVPIVAERPMYFNFRGIKSGTDVMGATNATGTQFYFAEGDTRASSNGQNYSTFITILNPSATSTAHVQITYYSHGSAVESDTVTVGPLQRGTGLPRIHQQFALKVTSDIGIVVERPMYFNDTIATAGGWTTGAASAIGATTLGPNSGSDWLFAEGYTGTGNNFQEYLVLANFTNSDTIANVKLEYTNGTVQTVPVTVPALSQYYFDVNYANSHPIGGCSCTPTSSLSAEVNASTPSIVAERLMYFHYGPQRISGGTDVVGEAGPSSHAVYTFAEGFTQGSFNEYLTLQNPNNSPETVAITLFADNTVVQEQLQLLPHSRTTVNINYLVVPMATAYPTNPNYLGYEVSMDIQAFNGTVVAERPLYFNYFGDPGGTDVLGYTGG